MTGNWRYDLSAERVVAAFLDAHFYPLIGLSSRRTDDRESQHRGCDVLLTFGGVENVVDEKCAHNYVRTDPREESLASFAFEISYLKEDGERQGWLYDPNKSTGYYLLCYLWATRKTGFAIGDILQMECLLVPREEVIVHLAVNGLTKDVAMEISRRLRSAEETGESSIGNVDAFRMRLSTKNSRGEPMPEQPVNAVVPKRFLAEMAIGHWMVGRDGIEALKLTPRLSRDRPSADARCGYHASARRTY